MALALVRAWSGLDNVKAGYMPTDKLLDLISRVNLESKKDVYSKNIVSQTDNTLLPRVFLKFDGGDDPIAYPWSNDNEASEYDGLLRYLKDKRNPRFYAALTEYTDTKFTVVDRSGAKTREEIQAVPGELLWDGNSGSARKPKTVTKIETEIENINAELQQVLNETVIPDGSSSGTGLAATRFLAYFQYMPVFRSTEADLQGKLVSELAAAKLLDDAALSSIDIKDAAFRLFSYAKTSGANLPANFDETFDTLIKDIKASRESSETASDQFQIQVAERALRKALVSNKFIPIRNMVNTQMEAEAGGKPTNVDAPTAEFERDMGGSQTSVEATASLIEEMALGVFSALFGSMPDKIKLRTDDTTSGDFGLQQAETVSVAYGAVLYNGRTEDMLPVAIPKNPANLRQKAVKEVEKIFYAGRIPINADHLINPLERDFIPKIEKYVERIRDNIATIARVENARDTDLAYKLISVDYGTSSTSPYFGTGTNVTMMTDCAFIAARVLNSLRDSFEPTKDGITGLEKWNSAWQLTGGNYTKDIRTISKQIRAQVNKSYTGHCTVRVADLGRLLSGTIVNIKLNRLIRNEAVRSGYRSLKHMNRGDFETRTHASLRKDNPMADSEAEEEAVDDEITYRNRPVPIGGVEPEVVEARFYHHIWEHELGNHAVAQGGARLDESHMMVPFLVRATSDSVHVVPTLCAYEDWVGPSEMYFRVEQEALMEVENYAHSRPSVKYARGGQGRLLSDVGAWIKHRNVAQEGPLSFITILGEVAPLHRDMAAKVCAMLMTAVYQFHRVSSEVRRGGLARQTASETSVRTLAERVGTLPTDERSSRV
jgi:hypothetical protein